MVPGARHLQKPVERAHGPISGQDRRRVGIAAARRVLPVSRRRALGGIRHGVRRGVGHGAS